MKPKNKIEELLNSYSQKVITQLTKEKKEAEDLIKHKAEANARLKKLLKNVAMPAVSSLFSMLKKYGHKTEIGIPQLQFDEDKEVMLYITVTLNPNEEYFDVTFIDQIKRKPLLITTTLEFDVDDVEEGEMKIKYEEITKEFITELMEIGVKKLLTKAKI